MIDRIFWDIDETLIHTDVHPSFGDNAGVFSFMLDDSYTYYTKVRPCSKMLIDFSRDLVGYDNVYILTTATKDYATTVNRLAQWGFDDAHIFAREDLDASMEKGPYGAYVAVHRPGIASPNNVIIDNLPSRENNRKIKFIGIENNLERYLRIEDYYGVDFPDDTFEKNVIDFLNNKQQTP